MVESLPRKVAQTIRRRRLFRARDSILVAVSGGPDSVALLAALIAIGRRSAWRIGVAHVNHGLRGRASDADERFVERLATRFGVPFHALEGRIGAGSALEERAREMRYRRLREAAEAGDYRRIAVAHTADDQAETLLFRLVRGAGSHGLAAMPFARGDGVVRPLLECTRADVLAHLAAAELRFRTDHSNRDPRFARNRIRHRVMPLLERELNPRARAALARAAELLAADDDHLDREARKRLARIASASGLDAPRLRRLPAALARRVVRLWLATVRDDARDTSLDHVDAILRLAEGGGSRSVSIPGCSVRRSGDHLRLGLGGAHPAPAAAILAPNRSVDFGDHRFELRRRAAARAPAPTSWRAIFDAAALGGVELRLRPSRPGERIRPLGLGGSKKLHDLFIDAKLPRERRVSYPVLDGDGDVLWVPGLARSDLAKVGARTRHVLVVECRPVEGR